jgi:HPt (histidine-containing phosphotransfer) domain-containing protein
LAGSCDSLGFRALANVLRLLEDAARINDETSVRLLAPQVDAQCQGSLDTLEHLLQR